MVFKDFIMSELNQLKAYLLYYQSLFVVPSLTILCIHDLRLALMSIHIWVQLLYTLTDISWEIPDFNSIFYQHGAAVKSIRVSPWSKWPWFIRCVCHRYLLWPEHEDKHKWKAAWYAKQMYTFPKIMGAVCLYLFPCVWSARTWIPLFWAPWLMMP